MFITSSDFERFVLQDSVPDWLRNGQVLADSFKKNGEMGPSCTCVVLALLYRVWVWFIAWFIAWFGLSHGFVYRAPV